MKSFVTRKLFVLSILLVIAVVVAMFAGKSMAQLSGNSLSGVYGCTMRDDRWGRTPEANHEYDVSGLVWILDATNKKMSGIDLRYRLSNTSGGSGVVVRDPPRIYKDEAATIEATELMNVYKLTVDEDGYLYLVATNGGNTLLVTGATSNNWVSESGICQKM